MLPNLKFKEDGYITGAGYRNISIWADVLKALGLTELWAVTAWNDVKSWYKYSYLGIYWIVIANAFFAVAIGAIYSGLLDTDFAEFVLYVYTGYIVWVYISDSLNNGTKIFLTSFSVYSQIRLPMVGFAVKSLIVRSIIFLVNLPVILVILFWNGAFSVSALLQAALGFTVLGLATFFFTVWCGILVALIRDISFMLVNATRFAFFITPIVWSETRLQGDWRIVFVEYNPFYYFISIIRKPLLGMEFVILDWIIAISITVLNALLAAYFYKRYRASLVFLCR